MQRCKCKRTFEEKHRPTCETRLQQVFELKLLSAADGCLGGSRRGRRLLLLEDELDAGVVGVWDDVGLVTLFWIE